MSSKLGAKQKEQIAKAIKSEKNLINAAKRHGVPETEIM